jgi:alpha-L-rhamnosidase
VPNPGVQAPTYRFEPVSARWVRVTVARLGHRDAANYGFALAELQVLASDKNVAQAAKVTALDSIELPASGWSKANLVDGRLRSEPGTPAVDLLPATMLRKDFDVDGAIKRATVSVTGLGLYELRLNGRKVGDRLLAPEWTRYSNRVQYQTWDVTDQVAQGHNTLGAQLAAGWWAGPLMLKPSLANARCCLLLRLDIELADGRTQTIATDPTWQATTDGPIRQSGIYFGETYDATKEMPGWDQPGFSANGWQQAEAIPHPQGIEQPLLVAQSNEPIRVVQELKPVNVTEPKPGVFVFDMGQNMVGWCRLSADAPAGTKITVRHAEMLNEDGTIYTANLRGAAQINEYTWRGGLARLEPHFTYHGFRYVEVTGLPGRPAADAVLGRVFHSAAPDAGKFTCSNELIDKIMHCAEWTQRGNMHSVPTDCPQRTERLGWMGDIQAFAQTAIFNMDMAAFFTKWVCDIRDSQADDGRFPDIAPHVGDPNSGFSGVPAWGDAGTVVPWRMYQNYADARLLEQHFESARRWVEYIRAHNANLLWQKNRGNDYNDWLNGDTLVLNDYPRGISAVPNEVFATAFFAHSTEIVAKMAKTLGRTEDAAKYATLFEDIKAAFNKAYVTPDGRILGDTQAGYALALHFNLLPEPLRPKATEHLLKAIAKYKGHPSTGIQTTHRMILELTRNGHHEEAWRIINLRTVPSWGYMVEMGATTIWERWDGYVAGRGFQDPGMNSFNHWAFGAVGEWVWRHLAGINPDESRPGFKHFTIRPRPVSGLSWATGRYDSIRGRIVSDWKTTDDSFALNVEIPANTTATVYVPARSADAVTESGVPADRAAGVKFLRMEEGAAVFEVESGRYQFLANAPAATHSP